ncbi:MAG: LysM peptidoglycan-binding domain-containing protein [Anaerolineae bacterium]
MKGFILKNYKDVLKMNLWIFALSIFLFNGCTSQFSALNSNRRQNDFILDELRFEIADLKSSLTALKTDLQLLEEKTEEQRQSAAQKSPKVALELANDLQKQLSSVEKNLRELYRIQDKVNHELDQFHRFSEETRAFFLQYRGKIASFEEAITEHSQKLNEVAKLKSTLVSISQAMQKEPVLEKSLQTHKIRSGETLEKIARTYQTSVEKIMRLNNLDNDRIMVGQELRIPNER